MKKILTFSLLIFTVFIKVECTTIKIATWNLQTFFDSTTEGTEYKEFINPKSHWNRESYIERLDRTVKAFKKINADILVLEEIENKNILYDIHNFDSATFLKNKVYKYAAFAKNENAAIGCAILSRYPIEKIKIHSIYIKNGKDSNPDLRPIIEAKINIKNKTITIFANHWKSKARSSDSNYWQNYQEQCLASQIERLIEKNANEIVIACGDFNKDINEFSLIKNNAFGNKNNILLSEKLAVYSPWIDVNDKYKEIGSYYYKNTWSKLDHFFIRGNIKIKAFYPMQKGDWSKKESTPYKYNIRTGKGYSDHLPLICIIDF
ncbi:MAG: endonuclease/exonuclease/phosphatase family protein [Treponema sp.]|nr:endonuclease/exonuclease/phosphatase family protein [Treponema sp.]